MHNALMALGALAALRDAGTTAPDDVAVVGFDDIPIAAHTEPSLTTVRQPCHDMGATAARMLLNHLADTPLPAEPVALDTNLVIRRTRSVMRRPASPASRTLRGNHRDDHRAPAADESRMIRRQGV